MKIKNYLQKLQKLLPSYWFEQIQYIHSILLFRWILHSRSQPLACNQKSAMVFSPHQDDETFGCGGMIAQKREQGTQVVVVFVTDGQGSGGLETSRDKIIQIRKREALTALSILGVAPSEIHFLEKTDGRLQELSSQEQQQTIKQIAELIKYYQPQEIYVLHQKDCHRDHEATYQLVKLAIYQFGIEVDLLQYPIWLFWRAPLFILLKFQDIAAAYYLSITSLQEKKRERSRHILLKFKAYHGV